MAVTATTTFVFYTGNGSATAFAVPFKFVSSSDLVVTKTVGSVTTTYSLGGHYTVTGAGVDAGGTVTFLTAPASGVTVKITRSTPATQPVSLAVQGNFSSKTHEAALDRTVLIEQETQARTSALESRVSVVETEIAAGVIGGGGGGGLGTSTALTILDNATPEAIGGAGSAKARSVGGAIQISENGAGYRPLFTDFTVEQFGAKGDGTTDDTSAIQAAINAATAVGGVLNLGPHTYRVTAQLLVGHRFVNENEVLIDLGSATLAASFSFPASDLAKQPAIKIHGVPSKTKIWCDYNPVTETAALYYGSIPFNEASFSGAEVTGIQFFAQDEMTAGVWGGGGSGGPTSNLMGFFCVWNGLRLEDCTFRGFRRGIVVSDCYYGEVRRCYVYRCVDGLTSLVGNGAITSNVRVYSATGTAFNFAGQGWSADNCHTENCAKELYIPGADNFVIRDCYWEDTDSAHTGFGSILGNGTATVVWGLIENIHYDKHAGSHFDLRKAQVKFHNVRAYIWDGTGDGSVYSFSRAQDNFCVWYEDWCHLPLSPSTSPDATYFGQGIEGGGDTQAVAIKLNGGGSVMSPATGKAVMNVTSGKVQLSENGGAYHLLRNSGSATASGATATASASFAVLETDTNYKVIVTPVSSTGTPAAGSNRVLSVSKSTNAFTITLEAAPGVGNTVTFDWSIQR